MAIAPSAQNHYEILGLSPAASSMEVRRAYLDLAKRWHPDVCTEPDALLRFQAIQAAYRVLRDADARALYDAQRRAADSQTALEAYRKQQADRRAQIKQRRNRRTGLGKWWR